MGETQTFEEEKIDWREHIPDVNECTAGPRVLADSVRKGQVYAYQRSSQSRGVVLITQDGGRDVVTLLAHTTSSPRTDWSVITPMSTGLVRLIADADGWVSGYSKAPAHAHKRPAPTEKPKGVREVSIDGQQYVNYDKMTDSDAFERYPYYRVRMPDGTFPVDEKPVMLAPVNTQRVCVVALCANPGPFGRQGECLSCHVKEEAIIATKTATMQRGRGASVTRVREHSPVQSHSMLWGGVFSLRE